MIHFFLKTINLLRNKKGAVNTTVCQVNVKNRNREMTVSFLESPKAGMVRANEEVVIEKFIN